MKQIFLFFFCSFLKIFLNAEIFPIGFSIPESKIVETIPEKFWDFAPLIPGDVSTYIYNEEEDYYEDYKKSYFAFTKIKAGADCLRHYEILACGCIPYFTDLDKVHPNTMTFFPKELVKEAMELPGVSCGAIDHSIFDKKRYFEILEKLLTHTRKYLTPKNMAQYVLDKVGCPNPKKILFLSYYLDADYLRCLMYIGFKQLLKERCHVFPKLERLHEDSKWPRELDYGRGFSISRILPPEKKMTLSDVKSVLKNDPYDLVIVGNIHRIPIDRIEVFQRYGVKIVYLCGLDFHKCEFKHLSPLFLREFCSV